MEKILASGSLILIAIISCFAAGYIPPAMVEHGVCEKVADIVQIIFRGIHLFGSLIGICWFAKSLHDPLTPKEAEELEQRETLEKTGRDE